MAKIFISYRRDDAPGHAGRLYDQLREDFGDTQVFMDVDAIEPGVDFVERIESAVATADVLVAVIGRGWLTAEDARGRRRLDDPEDFVRLEVGAALRRGITVVPVLVGGAPMPGPDELPPDLAGMARRNALTLSDLEWRSGVARLSAALEQVLGPTRREGREPKPPLQEGDSDRGAATPAALALGFAGGALLVAATALRWDALVDPAFGAGAVPNLGFATAPASLAVAGGALFALLKVARGGPEPLATGLLLGFSVGGLAKYGALLARFQGEQEGAAQLGSGLSLVLGFLGALILAGLAGSWLLARHRRDARFSRVVGRVLASVGAVLMAAGTLIPFNVSQGAQKVIVEVSLREALDPLGLAAAVVLTVVLAGRARQLVVSGLFVALGLLGALLWLRYVGVPALQMLQGEAGLASLRAGGFVGLAGSLLVWRAGIAAGRHATRGQEGRQLSG